MGNLQDDTETEILLNSPLLSTNVFKNSGDLLVNLQRYVTSAVKQFGDELDVHINRNTDLLTQRPAVSPNIEGLNGHLLPIHNYNILSG